MSESKTPATATPSSGPKKQIITMDGGIDQIIKVADHLTQADEAEVHRCASMNEVMQMAFQFSPCLVLISLNSRDEVVGAAGAVKKFQQNAKKYPIKTMIISAIDDKRIVETFQGLGCKDFLQKKIAVATLLYKVRLQLKAIQVKKDDGGAKLTVKEREAQKSADGSVTIKSDGDAAGAPALELAEDCWLIKGSKPKKLGKTVVIELEGPDPTSGSWISAGKNENGDEVWKWNPTDEAKEGEGWEFTGDMPEFRTGAKSWRFASKRPNLQYKKKGENAGSKIETKAGGELVIAKDSEQAKKNIEADHKRAILRQNDKKMKTSKSGEKPREVNDRTGGDQKPSGDSDGEDDDEESEVPDEARALKDKRRKDTRAAQASEESEDSEDEQSEDRASSPEKEDLDEEAPAQAGETKNKDSAQKKKASRELKLQDEEHEVLEEDEAAPTEAKSEDAEAGEIAARDDLTPEAKAPELKDGRTADPAAAAFKDARKPGEEADKPAPSDPLSLNSERETEWNDSEMGGSKPGAKGIQDKTGKQKTAGSELSDEHEDETQEESEFKDRTRDGVPETQSKFNSNLKDVDEEEDLDESESGDPVAPVASGAAKGALKTKKAGGSGTDESDEGENEDEDEESNEALPEHPSAKLARIKKEREAKAAKQLEVKEKQARKIGLKMNRLGDEDEADQTHDSQMGGAGRDKSALPDRIDGDVIASTLEEGDEIKGETRAAWNKNIDRRKKENNDYRPRGELLDDLSDTDRKELLGDDEKLEEELKAIESATPEELKEKQRKLETLSEQIAADDALLDEDAGEIEAEKQEVLEELDQIEKALEEPSEDDDLADPEVISKQSEALSEKLSELATQESKVEKTKQKLGEERERLDRIKEKLAEKALATGTDLSQEEDLSEEPSSLEEAEAPETSTEPQRAESETESFVMPEGAFPAVLNAFQFLIGLSDQARMLLKEENNAAQWVLSRLSGTLRAPITLVQREANGEQWSVELGNDPRLKRASQVSALPEYATRFPHSRIQGLELWLSTRLESEFTESEITELSRIFDALHEGYLGRERVSPNVTLSA